MKQNTRENISVTIVEQANLSWKVFPKHVLVLYTNCKIFKTHTLLHHNIVYYVNFLQYKQKKNTEMQYMNTAKCKVVTFFFFSRGHGSHF